MANPIQAWLVMCASNRELVSNFNRLRGTNLLFDMPGRSPIEVAVDVATGFHPVPNNHPDEVRAFVSFCLDMLARLDGAPTSSLPRRSTRPLDGEFA